MSNDAKNSYSPWVLTEKDFEAFKWWMTYDPIHKPEPMTPLAGCLLVYLEQHGFCYGAEKVSMPFSKGMCCRLDSSGYEAISEAIPTTKAEIEKRSRLFSEILEDFSDNFEKIWGDFRHKGKVGTRLLEIQENFAKIGTFCLDTWLFNLQEFRSYLRKKSDGDLLDLFYDVLEVDRRTWEIHFELKYLAFSIYMNFERLTKELFGINDGHPIFKKLMQGFSNKIYECDLELWRLVNALVESNIDKTFMVHPIQKVLFQLEKEPLGKKWLEQFQRFLSLYGRRSAVPHDIFKSTWLEDPAPILAIIRDRLKGAPFDYEDHHQKIVRERERTVSEIMDRVPAEKRDEFRKLLSAVQASYCWNEDHNYWIEQLWSSSTRYIVLEMGRRLVRGNATSESDDVFFLNPEEMKAIFLAATAGKYDLRELVALRKKAWKEAFGKPPQRITGKLLRSEVKDPILIKVFGLGPLSHPSKAVDLFGYPGSSGICDGIASVVMKFDELHSVEAGSILVTGATNPAWTIVFSKINGVVTDHGGTLSHAAIVAREYGIPAVVGTGNATQKIKNGWRIRVDGDRGYVWILSR